MASTESLRINQRNLDAFLEKQPQVRDMPKPAKGWIRTIREALGMTAAQLGQRMQTRNGEAGISGNSVLVLERNEAAGGISLGTLERAADALGCDVAYFLVPRTPLREMFDAQVSKRVNEIASSTATTMAIEGQNMASELAVQDEIARDLIKGNALWN